MSRIVAFSVKKNIDKFLHVSCPLLLNANEAVLSIFWLGGLKPYALLCHFQVVVNELVRPERALSNAPKNLLGAEHDGQ